MPGSLVLVRCPVQKKTVMTETVMTETVMTEKINKKTDFYQNDRNRVLDRFSRVATPAAGHAPSWVARRDELVRPVGKGTPLTDLAVSGNWRF